MKTIITFNTIDVKKVSGPLDILIHPDTPVSEGKSSPSTRAFASKTRRKQEYDPTRVAQLLSELFARHHRELVRHLNKILLNQDLAEEAAQEAYLRLLRYGQIPDAGKEKAYLFTTATRCSFNIRREERRQGSYRSNTSTVQFMTEDSIQAKQAVRRLPPRCRQVFLMHRVLGWRQAEIAKELQVSVSMVEKHIRRGRHMIEREAQIPKVAATVRLGRC